MRSASEKRPRSRSRSTAVFRTPGGALVCHRSLRPPVYEVERPLYETEREEEAALAETKQTAKQEAAAAAAGQEAQANWEDPARELARVSWKDSGGAEQIAKQEEASSSVQATRNDSAADLEAERQCQLRIVLCVIAWELACTEVALMDNFV
jgi:ribosomal protein L34E